MIKVPASRCPYCGHRLDAATPTRPNTEPSPGDLSLCVECCAWVVFDDELRLRKPTPKESAEFKRHPKLVMIQQVGLATTRERQSRQ